MVTFRHAIIGAVGLLQAATVVHAGHGSKQPDGSPATCYRLRYWGPDATCNRFYVPNSDAKSYKAENEIPRIVVYTGNTYYCCATKNYSGGVCSQRINEGPRFGTCADSALYCPLLKVFKMESGATSCIGDFIQNAHGFWTGSIGKTLNVTGVENRLDGTYVTLGCSKGGQIIGKEGDGSFQCVHTTTSTTSTTSTTTTSTSMAAGMSSTMLWIICGSIGGVGLLAILGVGAWICCESGEKSERRYRSDDPDPFY